MYPKGEADGKQVNIPAPCCEVETCVRLIKPQPTTRREGSREGEADLLLKCGEIEPRKAHVDDQHVRTKTETGR